MRKIITKNLGESLAEVRQKRFINLDEAAKDLNVPFRYLEALENNNFQDLPNQKYLKQLLNNYCKYLKIDLTVYRRILKNSPEFSQTYKSQKVEAKYFTVWPNLIRKIIILMMVAAILFFLIFKIEQIFSPPFLEITYPSDGLILNERQIKLVGRSEAEVELVINNREIFVDSAGNFSTIIDLQKGLNLIKISAKKRYSRLNEQDIRLLLKD